MPDVTNSTLVVPIYSTPILSILRLCPPMECKGEEAILLRQQITNVFNLKDLEKLFNGSFEDYQLDSFFMIDFPKLNTVINGTDCEAQINLYLFNREKNVEKHSKVEVTITAKKKNINSNELHTIFLQMQEKAKEIEREIRRIYLKEANLPEQQFDYTIETKLFGISGLVSYDIIENSFVQNKDDLAIKQFVKETLQEMQNGLKGVI